MNGQTAQESLHFSQPIKLICKVFCRNFAFLYLHCRCSSLVAVFNVLALMAAGFGTTLSLKLFYEGVETPGDGDLCIFSEPLGCVSSTTPHWSHFLKFPFLE